MKWLPIILCAGLLACSADKSDTSSSVAVQPGNTAADTAAADTAAAAPAKAPTTHFWIKLSNSKSLGEQLKEQVALVRKRQAEAGGLSKRELVRAVRLH